MREMKKEKSDHTTTTTQIAFVVAMNSVGEFLEKEIHGQSYLIYNFSSQTQNPSSTGEAAIDSGGDNDLPLFLCPSLRMPKQWGHTPLFLSPHFPNIKCGEKQPDYMLGSDICNLPLLPIFWCNNSKPDDNDFYCGACQSPMLGTSYYLCVTCLGKFHRECVESPLEIINHPFNPLFPLQLCSASRAKPGICIYCQEYVDSMAYHDPATYSLMHPVCAMKPIPFVIDHQKRHPHPLTLFPKQAYLPCNVCGLIEGKNFTYVCLRCVFVVHQDCLYFPYVIRISRHHHRISFAFSLPAGRLSCGVCRKEFEKKFGAYSCNECTGYFVHSRCALRRDLWDGKELEEEPEESEIVVEPFERIADGIILHFSHGHHLKLETSEVYNENKICQGCVLPIYEGGYYSCMDHECGGFILHEECANAPCRKISPLHPRPLSLKVVTDAYGDNEGFFRCDACGRLSCGFVYEDFKGEEGGSCKLDLRCASVSEPFTYQGHKHPLFLALNPEEEEREYCRICRHRNINGISRSRRKLNCIECSFAICYRCATLPHKARYKHDKHFLTFCQPEEANDRQEWCDVCERKIARFKNHGFYSCDDYCCTTIHIDCLLGEEEYLKPGHTIKYDEKYHHILVNKTLSRPVCNQCGHRCPHRVFLKDKNSIFCSVLCVENLRTPEYKKELYRKIRRVHRARRVVSEGDDDIIF